MNQPEGFDQYSADYRQLLQDAIGFSGEDASYFAEYKAQWLASRAGLAPDAKVLDYGCGVGLVSAALRHKLPGATLHGFDLSAESLAQMPAELRAAGRFTDDFDQLDRDYDLIVVINVLHHVPPPARPALAAQLAGALRPGGRLLIWEHNGLNPATRRVVDRCVFDHDAVLLRPRESRALVAGAGLVPHGPRYVVFFPRPLARLRFLEPALALCPAGAQYVVTGVRDGA